MARLAINGGKPVRKTPIGRWPVHTDEELAALRDVLQSGTWGIGGARVREFEETFARFQDASRGICVTSGTAGLQVALRACGIRAGDEVLVPPYTFFATASAVINLGAIPIFVDIEPDTYNIDPGLIEAALTPRTKAIVPVHIAGRPADLDAVLAVSRAHGIRVVEDACQAPGAEWKGRKVGAIGDVGVVSFQSTKNLNAGEGGIVLSCDGRLADLAWSYHNCGRMPGGAWYEHPLVGWNFRMTEWQAAILLVQFRRFEDQHRKRSANAALLRTLLSSFEGVGLLKKDPRITRDAVHLFIMRYQSANFGGAPRSAFLKALAAEGVPCSAGYVPLYKEKAFLDAEETFLVSSSLTGRRVDYSLVRCPICETVCGQESVWLNQSLFLCEEEDIHDIAGAVQKIRDNCHELANVRA